MLTIPLEKLTYIIEKAREFDAEVPAEAEKRLQKLGDGVALFVVKRHKVSVVGQFEIIRHRLKRCA